MKLFVPPLKPWCRAVLTIAVCGGIVAFNQNFKVAARADTSPSDPSLVIHYDFTQNPGNVVKDLSGHGNDGKIAQAKWLPEVEGRRGVLRFDGNTSTIDCGKNESTSFNGDATFSLWLRLNAPITNRDSFIFGENPYQQMMFMMAQYNSLLLRYNSADSDSAVIPVTRSILSDKWSQITVVIEYPRCRFYSNGKLIHDAYMPMPGIQEAIKRPKQLGGGKNNGVPFDLSEFKFYRRALSAGEVAADYQRNANPTQTPPELVVEPNWYNDILTVRFVGKGERYKARRVSIALRSAKGTELLPAQSLVLSDVSKNASQRYAASATFPLKSLNGQKFKAVAQIEDSKTIVERDVAAIKPAWIRNQDGISSKVLASWTPVRASRSDGTIKVGVWGRDYTFDHSAVMKQVRTKGTDFLSSAVTLNGRVDGREIGWKQTRVELNDATARAADITGQGRDGGLSYRINSTTEYDGYTIFDCEVKAEQAVNLEQLKVDIPIKSANATLAYSDRGLPKQGVIHISETYAGEVKQDLSFLFSQVWIGNRDVGLYWQSESDEHWYNADKQKAIQILPRGGTTFLRANFVDTPTQLQAGQTLRYKFALQATPIKPMLRDAWDLRIMRSGPYGNDLHYPEWKTEGKPTLQTLADYGVRRLFINVNETWPWPMPERKQFTEPLHKLIKSVHGHGLKAHPYLMHIRFPVTVPEYDIYGAQMSQSPTKPYVQPGSPMNTIPNPRPGPLSVEFGADSQGAVIYCPKSAAAQDAYMHSLAQRLKLFNDDGVYLDGTGQIMPCTNPLHGCGYRDRDGKMHPTYPVFAARELNRRIYTIVKEHDPDAVVDLHSWFHNPAQAAYADIIWTGEQWHHLRLTGAPNDYITAQMPLDMFQAMFTGRQTGTPVEMLSYRLGSTMKVNATSLLHDVPVRLNQSGRGLETLLDGSDKVEKNYFKLLTTLWKVREQFDIDKAQKHFYWDNKDYVQVLGDKSYSTLFHNPNTGVLAYVTNLSPGKQDVTLRFNLQKLGLAGRKLTITNALTGQSLIINEAGEVTLPLNTEEWAYLWLKP